MSNSPRAYSSQRTAFPTSFASNPSAFVWPSAIDSETLPGRFPKQRPESLLHELVMRQMPVEARTSSKRNQGALILPFSIRVLDPLPAIELRFFEPAEGGGPNQRVDVALHQQLTGYMLQAALVKTETDEEVEFLADGKTRALCGVFLSSLFPVPDPDSGTPTLFFAFPDLAVRATGEFRLRFTLSVMGPTGCPKLMTINSPPFRVLTAAKYGGVQNSTALTRALANHGAHARVRNKARGARPRTSARRRLEDLVSASSSPPHSSTCGQNPVSRVAVDATTVQPSTPLLPLHAPRPCYPPSSDALEHLLAHIMHHGQSPVPRDAGGLHCDVGMDLASGEAAHN
ncbi:velvet factor-domain-containing protein, partial [Mycena metata]